MNNSNGEMPGPSLNLPRPVPEQASAVNTSEQPPLSGEQAPLAPAPAERAPLPAVSLPAAGPVWPTPPANDQTDDTQNAATSNDVVNTSQSSLPKILNDKDLIDKAVVEKAKAIVARTSEDPYRQTQELTNLKAEFLQQNYNKVIKLDQ